jgi:aldehyde:ferredoxin oxidoreductase
LPERFFQPHTSGALAETAINRDEFKNAILNYYKMMGWDEEGIPTKSKIEELELNWIL